MPNTVLPLPLRKNARPPWMRSWRPSLRLPRRKPSELPFSKNCWTVDGRSKRSSRRNSANGLCSEADVDKAKAETLGDEIRLAKEKSAASVENSTPPRNREAEENIRKLQDERIVSLAKTFVIIDAQYSVARAEFGQRIAASDALLQAQLDVAESKLAQIAVCRNCYRIGWMPRSTPNRSSKSGTGSEADYLRAKAKREAAESSVATENAATSPDDSAAKPVDPNNPHEPDLALLGSGRSSEGHDKR